MDILRCILQVLAVVSGSMAAVMSMLIILRLQWPAPVLWILKLLTVAFSPLFFGIGVLCVLVGLATESVFLGIIGLYDGLFYLIYIIRVTRPPDVASGFEQAFGLNWENRLNAAQKEQLLPSRTILTLPAVPMPRLEQNIAFTTIPGTDRQLLCDVWQPNASVAPSGLAFIYMHGSAWALLDKDLGTRPFFKQLATQGHVIMDVAYRLAHETDMMGMVQDVKRAIGWMKANAATFGVNPDTVVVGGGSAGAHLALLAGYTADNPLFTPKELNGTDLGVCGVVSLYGPTDLKAMYFHTNQQITTRSTPGKPKKAMPVQMPAWIIHLMGKAYYRFHFDKDFANAGVFPVLLGGHPDECPEQYALFSPVTHVHANCPATLQIQGEHDLMASVKTTRLMHARLAEEKVPAVMHILPQTDHAFDLIMPGISPSAHSAIYDVERFLALRVRNGEWAAVVREALEE